MIHEELYVYDNDGNRRKVDIEVPSGITLKWESNLFCDLSKLSCSYSYTFKLPMTRNNRDVLDMAEDVRASSTMLRKKVKAEFYVNGVCLCPNANLYVSEVSGTYSCVMTWRVLTGLQTLKEADKNINELESIGSITWKDEDSEITYGVPSMSLSNGDDVVYPVYDAGIPYTTGFPPKPAVPVYRLIQMINEEFGVRFDIGRFLENSMGVMPENDFNNSRHHNMNVYDDYVTHGAIPLTGIGISEQNRFALYGITFDMSMSYVIGTAKFSVTNGYKIVYQSGKATEYSPYYNGVLREGYSSEILEDERKLEFIGVASFKEFKGNKYIKGFGVYVTGKSEDYSEKNVTSSPIAQLWPSTGKVYYYGCDYEYNFKKYFAKSIGQRSGLSVSADCTVKGTAEVIVPKSCVADGSFTLTDYHRIYVLKANKPDENGEIEVSVHSDSGNDWIGLMSTERTETDTEYVYHYDFGVQNAVRALKLSALGEDELGYMFWSGVRQEDAENEEGVKGNADIKFGSFNIVSIEPDVTYDALPAQLDIVGNLPSIGVFDFMKSVFYMNGAMPRVQADGETICAMYYNQIRDRVREGVCIDWSRKMLGNVYDAPLSLKFNDTNFGRRNYFDLAYTDRDMTQDEKDEEVDIYINGSGSIDIDDNTLDEEKDLYQAPFYPPFAKDLAYPNVKTGNTTKVWMYDENGMRSINTEEVKPIYGFLVYRGLDSAFEDVTVNSNRPQISTMGSSYKQIHLNTFNPFADMSKMFGYWSEVTSNYYKVKEKFLLDEFDLRDFDESMPVYLEKYNSFFAVVTIQRDKDGVCTCEMVRLPVVEVTEPDPEPTASVGVFGNISWGTIRLIYGSNYRYRTGDTGAWRSLASSTMNIETACQNYKYVTGNAKDNNEVFEISIEATGNYDYIRDGQTTHYTNKAEVFVNGQKVERQSTVAVNYTGCPRVQMEFRLPMYDDNGNLVTTKVLTSPLFVQPTYPEEYTNSEYIRNYRLGNFGMTVEGGRFAWRRSIDTGWNYVNSSTLYIPEDVISENCNQIEVMLKCSGTNYISYSGIKYSYEKVTVTSQGESVESVEKRVVDYYSKDVGGGIYLSKGEQKNATMYVKVEESSLGTSKKPFNIKFIGVATIE